MAPVFFICSVMEDLSSAGSVKDSSCRTWICCWTGRTSTACCWELSAWSWKPRTRMHRFSWGSWRTRWSRDSTASTRHVESRNTPAASAARLLLKCVFFGRTLEKKIKQMLKLFIVFINLTHANVSDPSHRHFDLQRQETRTFPDGFCFFDCWLNKLSNLFLYLLCYS